MVHLGQKFAAKLAWISRAQRLVPDYYGVKIDEAWLMRHGTALERKPNTVIVAFNHFIDDPACEKLVAAFVEKGILESSVE